MDFNKQNEQGGEWDGVTLSVQAISVLMVALQKCLVEQSDIVPILKDLKWARHMDTDELHVLNPPSSVQLDFPDDDEEE